MQALEDDLEFASNQRGDLNVTSKEAKHELLEELLNELRGQKTVWTPDANKPVEGRILPHDTFAGNAAKAFGMINSNIAEDTANYKFFSPRNRVEALQLAMMAQALSRKRSAQTMDIIARRYMALKIRDDMQKQGERKPHMGAAAIQVAYEKDKVAPDDVMRAARKYVKEMELALKDKKKDEEEKKEKEDE
jgi:hypothetical protein